MWLSFLPVVVTTRVAPTQAIATHDEVNVAALDVTTTKTGVGGDMWVGASSANAEVATIDEVAVVKTETLVDRDPVELNLRVPALETEQSCGMRWEVASVEELSGRTLNECTRKDGTRDPDLPGGHVRQHGDNEESGGRAGGPVGWRAGWLWERERHRDAQRDGSDAAPGAVGTQ
jgi:hypothetical protein